MAGIGIIIMKKILFLLLFLVSLYACEKSGGSSKIISTDFQHYILEGYDITSIAFDNLGNAWMGTFNAFSPGDINKPELIKHNIELNSSVIYNASNSLIKDSIYIWDIAVDNKNNVWIGCDGLIKFDGINFTKYYPGNTIIPEDFITSIAVDSKDNIWFSSSRVASGGLVMYNGTNWNVYTPHNSALSMNGISSIAVDHDDNVWLAQFGYLSEACLVKINDNTWTEYLKEELASPAAKLRNIAIDSKNRVCAVLDYTLDNPDYSIQRDQIIIFDGLDSKQLENPGFDSIKGIIVDNDDNIWCVISNINEEFRGSSLAIYDGSDWLIDSMTFRNTRIETIVQSKDNNIWLGTANGVYTNKH